MRRKWILLAAVLTLGLSFPTYAAETADAAQDSQQAMILSVDESEDTESDGADLSVEASDEAAGIADVADEAEVAEAEPAIEIAIESEVVEDVTDDADDEASAIAADGSEAADTAAAIAEVSDGLVTENGYTFYYKNGVLQTGWQTVSGNTYYFYKSAKGSVPKGAAATGLTKIGSYRYYFNSKGVMQTGKKTINGKIYYFYKSEKDGAPKGSAATGLVKISGSYYYFSSTGKACTSKWKTITASNGTSYKYYFRSNGKAYADKVVEINGATYAFDSKGRMLTGVQVIDYQFYVFYSNGKLNTTKTNKLRKASAYESDASTLISLLEKYGATLKETNYYGSSCYGNGEDGEMVYDTFTIYIFRYASTGKIIVFSVE